MEIEEAIKLITDAAAPVTETMTVPLLDAYGRIAAEDMISEGPVPAFDRSAMDGYAVHSQDVARATKDDPVRLKVIAEISAGDPTDLRYTPGSAVRVMTGAMIPEGYDAVIKQEDTDYGEDEVKIASECEGLGVVERAAGNIPTLLLILTQRGHRLVERNGLHIIMHHAVGVNIRGYDGGFLECRADGDLSVRHRK